MSVSYSLTDITSSYKKSREQALKITLKTQIWLEGSGLGLG